MQAGMFDRQEAKDAKGALCEPGERLDNLAHQVIGAAIEVHRHLGPGRPCRGGDSSKSFEVVKEDLDAVA
jgi:hypothetical protein